MGIFFSKKEKPSRVSENDLAVLRLKTQRDNLSKYQKRIETNLEQERNLAKQLLTEGKHDRAKVLLRKKRYQEQLLKETDGQIENIAKLIGDLEKAQIDAKVIETMEIGNTALKKMNAMFNIEDIERIMDETREGIDKQNEINELLSGALNEEDEDAVEAEFEALIGRESIPEKLPDVPTDELVAEKSKEAKKKKTKEPEAEMLAA
ncbi:charged multivesicular body protein 6-A [Planococcus citri]|uniref:charged multivesicular body protein 6-A n=1 Tax=Planococcus citri TaxID=170843 RepID=UPI0031F746D7